jgi:hypothetical protein
MLMRMVDVRAVWDRVLPGLLAILRKCAADWRPEDVYSRLVSGEWSLFMAEGVDGFAVFSQYVSPYTLEKRLVVECCYFDGDDLWSRFEPELMQLARDVGAVCVECRSTRLGYQRKGWQVADILYRKEVG